MACELPQLCLVQSSGVLPKDNYVPPFFLSSVTTSFFHHISFVCLFDMLTLTLFCFPPPPGTSRLLSLQLPSGPFFPLIIPETFPLPRQKVFFFSNDGPCCLIPTFFSLCALSPPRFRSSPSICKSDDPFFFLPFF